jgi:hypothetical protein
MCPCPYIIEELTSSPSTSPLASLGSPSRERDHCHHGRPSSLPSCLTAPLLLGLPWPCTARLPTGCARPSCRLQGMPQRLRLVIVAVGAMDARGQSTSGHHMPSRACHQLRHAVLYAEQLRSSSASPLGSLSSCRSAARRELSWLGP